MSKKLPRTSQRTLDDLRKAANAALESEQRVHRSAPSPSPVSNDEASPKQRDDVDDSEPVTTTAPEDVTLSSAEADSGIASANLPAKPELPSKATFRVSSGRLIIERHANFAAVAGLVPMPWIDLAAIAVIVERMLRKLARLYGEPLETNQSKRLATAMLTGMAAPGIASFTTTGLLRMTPGPHLLGMAITSVSAAVLVRIIGDVYLTHLKGGLEAT